jgi:hypothetical protein
LRTPGTASIVSAAMRQTCIALLIAAILAAPGFVGKARAQDQASLDEFSVLMEYLIGKVTSLETAYSPALTGNIARTRRLEIYSRSVPEIDLTAAKASGRTDANSIRLLSLIEQVRSMDPAESGFLPVMEELWVRSIVLECAIKGIGPDAVKAYIRREAATFVADRGDFTRPEFDESALDAEDHVRIYFCGFGMVVLLQMEGGQDRAIELYRESTDLKGFYANQLVFRATDLDMAGLPLLEAVLFDPSVRPAVGEYLYGLIAGKLIGPGSQFGGEVSLSDEWKRTISDWVCAYVRTPGRLEARRGMPFYGVELDQASLGPETLLGVLGPISRTNIAGLLSSDDPIQNVAGLEALRWFDMDLYPDDAGFLLSIAEPLMASDDFALALLAKEAFDADARYMGEPYDDARRGRLRAALPAFCDLMDRAIEHPDIEYVTSTAWFDIYQEGTLTDLLAGCMPMVAHVVVTDWSDSQAGEEVYVPEGEIELLAYFIPANTALFHTTSDAVRGFLEFELDSGQVNPFRVWAYVEYLQAARRADSFKLSDEWMSALVRLKAWANNATTLIRGDDLKTALDDLLR